jgi:hypothetical protein
MDLRMYSKLLVITLGLVPTTILLLLSFIPLGISFSFIFDSTYDFSVSLILIPIAGIVGYIGMLSLSFKLPISQMQQRYSLVLGLIAILYVAFGNIPELNKSTTQFDIGMFIYFFLSPSLVAIYHLVKVRNIGRSVT